MKKDNRGGKRDGSGRPKGNPTKVLSYRVPQKIAGTIDRKIREIIEDFKPGLISGK